VFFTAVVTEYVMILPHLHTHVTPCHNRRKKFPIA
jgi:hypothetical protein